VLSFRPLSAGYSLLLSSIVSRLLSSARSPPLLLLSLVLRLRRRVCLMAWRVVVSPPGRHFPGQGLPVGVGRFPVRHGAPDPARCGASDWDLGHTCCLLLRLKVTGDASWSGRVGAFWYVKGVPAENMRFGRSGVGLFGPTAHDVLRWAFPSRLVLAAPGVDSGRAGLVRRVDLGGRRNCACSSFCWCCRVCFRLASCAFFFVSSLGLPLWHRSLLGWLFCCAFCLGPALAFRSCFCLVTVSVPRWFGVPGAFWPDRSLGLGLASGGCGSPWFCSLGAPFGGCRRFSGTCRARLVEWFPVFQLAPALGPRSPLYL